MALTRAQLLSGNSTQGRVLTGQPQAVTQGTGLVIASNGQISFDTTTATGVVKTNNTSAYNSYVWPTISATAGQQLTSDASGNLSWADSDGIAWTAKGQLVVGTGVAAQTILNVGADNTILIADSTQTSGLGYTSNFVATTGSTGAANIPAGTLSARPASPSTGGFRLNTSAGLLEYYDGSGWQIVVSSTTGTYVTTWNGGSTGLTPAAATSGAVTLGGILGVTNGGTGQTTTAGAINGLLPSQSGNANGVLTTDGTNTSWTPFVSSIVAGTNITLSPVGGTGAVTISSAGVAAGVSSFSAGSTGLTPAATTTGAVSLGGTLALASGGTGATTQAAAINNLLPSQASNVGYFLKTDGTDASWSSSATEIPSGTIMLFMQAAAPTGWTQVTTQNNVGIRIVNTAGGGTGGTIAFSTLFSATSAYTGSVTITSGQVGDTTLSVAQLASHDHYLGNICTWPGGVDDPGGGGNNHNNSNPTSATTGSSDVHTHSLIGVVAAGNFSSNFNLQYVDVIAASKN